MLAYCLLLAAFPAHADLYRWVDPQSGSVKFSSLPPPWYGDARRQAGAPAVEVLSYQPAVKPAPPPPRAQSALEERWRGLLRVLAVLPQQPDFDRAGQAIQQQVQAYEAVRAELDRMDPNGAARRRAEEGGLFERLKKGLEAQIR
jgi:hypothetical protein